MVGKERCPGRNNHKASNEHCEDCTTINVYLCIHILIVPHTFIGHRRLYKKLHVGADGCTNQSNYHEQISIHVSAISSDLGQKQLVHNMSPVGFGGEGSWHIRQKTKRHEQEDFLHASI